MPLSRDIRDEDNAFLKREVIEEEIWQTIHQIHHLKALGLDSMHAFFYERCWHIIGNTVIHAVKVFLAQGNMLRELIKHTLHQFQNNTECLSYYRPNTLYSVSYEIISKLVANRLWPILQKIISPLQSAFVHNKHIHDNILTANEILSSFLEKRKTGNVAIKLDMRKAYNRLEWSFIKKCFLDLWFRDQWIKWITECLKTTTFTMLVNGQPKVFHPKRSIRQGYPISPFIFFYVQNT